jgi:hypothetical protein
MEYVLENLNAEQIKNVCQVLADIQAHIEQQGKTEHLDLGALEGLEGVLRSDHKAIIDSLIKNRVLALTFPDNYNGTYMVNVDKAAFDQLYQKLQSKL